MIITEFLDLSAMLEPEPQESLDVSKMFATEPEPDTKNGRSGRIRTRDLRFWRPLLFQLSYTPKAKAYITTNWKKN
jgi:hypothetical protein